MKSRSLPYVTALIAAGAVLAAVWAFDRLEQERFHEANRTSVIHRLSTVRARLEGALNARLFLTQGLLGHVSTHPGVNQVQFQTLARVVIAGHTGIRSIQLAKNSVVSHLFPLEGNEEARGLRLLELPDQRAAVLRALETKKTVVAGPVDLVQGGVAFVSRTPIYLTPPGAPPGSGRYWGLATILIDKDTLLREAGLFDASAGLQYSIRGKDGLGAQGEVFFGDGATFGAHPVLLDVYLPNGSWQLAAIPVGGWPAVSPRRWVFRIGGALLAIMAAGLAYMVTLYQTRVAEREQRLRLMVENLPAGAVYVEGDRVTMNKAAEAITGYQRSELTTRAQWFDRLHGSRAEIFRGSYEADRAAGFPVSRAVPIIRRDGEERIVEFATYRFEGGEVWLSHDVTEREQAHEALRRARDELERRVQDRTAQLRETVQALEAQIAERRRAQELLQKSEERLRSLVETTRAIPWEADAITWQFTYVGPQAVEILGYPVDQWYEKDFWVVHLHPDDREFAIEFCQQSSTRLKDYEFEYRMIAADGRVVWLHDIVSVESVDGTPKTLRGFMIDVTARKEAEQALRESEEKYRLTAETASDAIVTIGEDSRIIYANHAAEKVFGYPVEELLGQPLTVLMPEALRLRHGAALKKFLDTGQRSIPWDGLEVTGIHRSGREVPLEISFGAMRQADGAYLFTGIIRDITERKRLERAVLEASEQEQRRIGQDLHDGLSQHLTGIAFLGAGIAQKLAEKSLPEADEVARISHLVNQAIAQTRTLARGLYPVHLEATGLVAALREFAEHVADLFKITCRFHCDDPTLTLDHAKAVHLYHVAREAVQNAIKHGQARHVTIVLAAERDGGILTVRDYGVGLREGMGRTRGMGLYLMEQRARMIGGSLAVERHPAGGTIVMCAFPLETAKGKGEGRDRREETPEA